MFTGLIEEIGKVRNIVSIGGGKRITIGAEKIPEDLKVDDSVCVNGVCLTVTDMNSNSFSADAVGDTLKKTTIGGLQAGDPVNLERALRLSDRLGGHLVQGHVNGIGNIKTISRLGENYRIEITFPKELRKYFTAEGSIAVDGISLTIAEINESLIALSIIPHTWKSTNLRYKSIGEPVNIEVDVISKYVENFVLKKKSNGLSFEGMKNAGF